jgi:hypothetical protein
LSYAKHFSTPHQINLPTALELGKMLDLVMFPKITIFTVEPKDIPDTTVREPAATSKSLSLISKGKVTTEAAVSPVDGTVVYIVRLMCNGTINPNYVLRAFEQVADGVIVSGCKYTDCHYIDSLVKYNVVFDKKVS